LLATLSTILNEICQSPASFPAESDIDISVTAQVVLNKILKSAPKCPPELREICKQLRIIIVDKFADERFAMAMVVSFVFLRFFCPALVSPSNFGFNVNPDTEARSVLIKVAKKIQTLANSVGFKGKIGTQDDLEHDPFITQNTIPVTGFLEELMEIPDEKNVYKKQIEHDQTEFQQKKKQRNRATF